MDQAGFTLVFYSNSFSFCEIADRSSCYLCIVNPSWFLRPAPVVNPVIQYGVTEPIIARVGFATGNSLILPASLA